jgi:enamine deaminase RidA (YjgF/YER057c/UK114 family)
MRLLTRRLGEVTPQVQERIQNLSIAQLENLGEALLDFTNVTDLEAWLDTVEDCSLLEEREETSES